MGTKISSIETRIDKCYQDLQEVVNSGKGYQTRTLARCANMRQCATDFIALLDRILGCTSVEALETDKDDHLPPSVKPDVDVLSIASNTQIIEQISNASAVSDMERGNISATNSYDIDYKATYRMMSEVINQLHMIQSEYKDVKELAKLIYIWYRGRIVTEYKGFERFRYSPKRIATILQAIVLAYGYFCENRMTGVLLNQFKTWFNKLGVDAKTTTNYAAPPIIANYEVLISEQSSQSKVDYAKRYVDTNGFTVAAMLFWDELYSAAFHKLHSFNPCVFPSADALYEIVYSHNRKAATTYQEIYDTPKLDYSDYNIS